MDPNDNNGITIMHVFLISKCKHKHDLKALKRYMKSKLKLKKIIFFLEYL